MSIGTSKAIDDKFNLFLAKVIQDELNKQTEKIFEKRKKEMLEEIKNKKIEIIQNTVKRITTQMNPSNLSSNLIITIRKEDK